MDWTLGFLFTAMQQHDLSRDVERAVMFFAVVLHNKLIRISVNVPPQVLSDHSMIDVTLDLRCANHHGSTSVTCRTWRSFSYDYFERDLQQSSLVCSPPSDVNELVAATRSLHC